MPYYLFTYHAFGSWMPDRKQGYVRRGQGILVPDHVMAERYRAAMTQGAVEFNSAIQLAIIDILLESREAAIRTLFRGHGNQSRARLSGLAG